MNECIVCYKQAEALCQRCRTPYCSRRCQAEDWPEHKASCIPMPQLVAAKRSGSPRSRLNESVSSVQQRLKYNANDSDGKATQQVNGSVSDRSNLVQTIKQKDEESPLRLLKHSDGKAKQQVNGSVSDRSNLVQTIKQKEEESPLRPLKHSDGKTKQQVNGSESNRSNVVQKIKQEDDESPLRLLKDSDEKPKQQVNGSVSDRSNLVQTIKQEDEESPLRPPKSKLPTEIIPSTDTATAISPSMFGNPFKRNSQNIGFNANVNKNRLSLPEGLLPEARPISGVHNRGILTEPTVSVPVKSSVVDVTRKEETDREEIVPQVSMQSFSLNEEKKKVIETEHQQGREEIFTMKDIKIVPLTVDKKMVCLDSSNIEKGYVSLCANDGKAVALIDRMSSTIANYCNSRANDSYRPQTGELCLCLFDEDNEWYRAVVLKVMDTDSFQVSFIDYGNVSTARTKNIRKMPREFMHHCLVNTCYIEGFDDSSPEAKLRVEQFFSNNPILEVANLKQLKSGVYLIELDC